MKLSLVRSSGAALYLAVAGLAVLSACATTISAGSDAPPPTPQGPSFTGADTGTTPATDPDGGLCNAYDCPAPYATCPGTSGLCTVNLSNDDQHCGDCDTTCPNSLQIVQKLHANFLCAKSKCQMACTPGYGDCNGFVDDGCETWIDRDRKNCGACGTVCPAGQICYLGGCGCPPGYTQCGNDCVKTDEDPNNCGACDNVCDPTTAPNDQATWPCGKDTYPDNSMFLCANAKCKVACAPGFASCNADACGDGCETHTDADHDHCGDCTTKCGDDQICFNGKCICGPDKTRCGTDCVDLQNDAENCGACGNQCPGLQGDDYNGRGSPLCVLGRCTYHCPPGFADCDHRIENGCEVNLNTDPLHCGTCDTQCDVKGGQPCGAGRCLTRPCDAGGVF